MKTLILFSMFAATQAFAWGPTGHRVTGHIAEKHLDKGIRKEIQRILKGESLSRVSTWADEIKSEPETYSFTYNWHFTDWPDHAHDHEENGEGSLIRAIHDQLKVIKDKSASDESKAFALKFLVHLVGDLHQPLHVGNGLDRGGNNCRVLFHGRSTNLHSLWDEGMIEFTKLSFTEMANYVSQSRSKDYIANALKSDVLDWALESKNIRGKIYPANVIEPEEPISVRSYCRRDVVVTESAIPKLGFEYSYRFVPVMEERLFLGGIRLAKLLNEALR
jgi:hypothetical protein